MSFILLILVLLILATPVTIIFDGPIIQGLVAAVAAIMAGVVALRIRPGEAGFLSTVIRPMALIAAVPAIWMLIQIMPLQSVGFAHPIWESAAAALGKPLAGTISVDPGDTVVSFVRYLSAIAIAFVAAAAAIDRRRAEWVLIALTVATTSIALIALAANLGAFAFVSFGSGQVRVAATNCAGLGVIFASAAALHTYERGNTRRSDSSITWSSPTIPACVVALTICSLAVVTGATSQTYFAIVCSLATLAVAVMIRRFSFGPWGIAAVISIALFVVIAAIAQANSRTVALTLAFATQAPARLIALTQRILTESNWTGTGAGTFAAVLPIYRNIDELAIGDVAPTAAAAIAVEMGRPFFWATMLAAIVLIVALMRGALRRQRDSFYSVAGASCIVAVALLSFGNSALLGTTFLIIVAVAIGMAVAQSKSRLI